MLDKFMHSRFFLVFPIQLIYISVFLPAGVSKFMNLSGTTAYFSKIFEKTFIMSLPVPGGMQTHVLMIALLEVIIALCFLIAIFRREFLPIGSCLKFTRLGIFLAAILFVQLGFGMRIAKDFQSAADLFNYFALTQILAFLLYMKFPRGEEKDPTSMNP